MPGVAWTNPVRLLRHEDVFEENFRQSRQVWNPFNFLVYYSWFFTGWKKQTRRDWELNLKTWLRCIENLIKTKSNFEVKQIPTRLDKVKPWFAQTVCPWSQTLSMGYGCMGYHSMGFGTTLIERYFGTHIWTIYSHSDPLNVFHFGFGSGDLGLGLGIGLDWACQNDQRIYLYSLMILAIFIHLSIYHGISPELPKPFFLSVVDTW